MAEMTDTTSKKAPIPYGGINRIALVARDMAETVEFYTKVLDMPLVKTINLPNGGQHFFFDTGNGGTISFLWFPGAPKVAPGIGSVKVTPENSAGHSAIGSMNHLALTIPLEKFDEYAERLKKRGLKMLVVKNHNHPPYPGATPEATPTTWVKSMYFPDPNGIRMEFAAYTAPFSEKDLQLDPTDASGKPVKMKIYKKLPGQKAAAE